MVAQPQEVAKRIPRKPAEQGVGGIRGRRCPRGHPGAAEPPRSPKPKGVLQPTLLTSPHHSTFSGERAQAGGRSASSKTQRRGSTAR